jgi:hypothetical protein
LKINYISKEHITIIFRVEERAMQVTSSALLTTCFQAGFFFGSFFYLEAKDSMFLQNVG